MCFATAAERTGEATGPFMLASTHWLRHTYGTHAVETMPIQILQMQMGHESPTTTAIYATTDLTRLATISRPWPASGSLS